MSDLVQLLPQPQVTVTQLSAKVTSGTGISVVSSGGSLQVSLATPVAIGFGGTGTETVPTEGQLLIGTSAGGYTPAALTAEAGITIANGSGSIQIGVSGEVAMANSVNDWTASQLPNANATYALGSSTLGWSSLFLGNGTYTAQIVPTALTKNVTVSLPNAASNTIQPLTGATTNEFLTYIDSSGTQHLEQPAFSNLSGTITAGQFPNTIAPVQPIATATANEWVTNITSTGLQVLSQPGFTNLSGTIAAGQFPSTVAPVQPLTGAVANNWLTYIDASGLQHSAQPGFVNLNGTIASGQFPNTIAPVQPMATASANEWVTNITSTGLQVLAQPSFANLSGTLSGSQYGNQPATSWFGNPTGSTALPTFNTTPLPNALVNWSSPSPIGTTVPNVGVFTTLQFAQLGQPAITNVTSNGTTGADTWGYQVVAYYADGTYSPASAQVTTSGANGIATLSGANSQTINWSTVSGAAYYAVYRTLIPSGGSPSTTGLIATNITATTYTDTGLAGDGTTAPSTNTSGSIVSGVAGGAVDVRVARAAAGQMEVDSGTQGQYGGLTLSSILLHGITPCPAPTVVPTGSASTTYTYQAVPLDAMGNTGAASAPAQIYNGPTTLSGTTFNTVTAPSPAGATMISLYRNQGGASQGLIATVAPGLSINDTGLAGDGTFPPPNSQLCALGFDSAHTGSAVVAVQPFFNKWTEGDAGIAITDGLYGNYADLACSNVKAIGCPSGKVAPMVTPVGTPGSTTYSYVIVAVDGSGNQTAPSPVGSTTTGNATQSLTNYNEITWAAFGFNSTTALNGQVHAYQIFRVAGGANQGLIGILNVENANGSIPDNATIFSFSDAGQYRSGYTIPTNNQTGAVRMYNADLNSYMTLQCGPENSELQLMNGATTFPWTNTAYLPLYDPNALRGGYTNQLRMQPNRQVSFDLYDEFFYAVSPGTANLMGPFEFNGAGETLNIATSAGFGPGDPGYIQLATSTAASNWSAIFTSASMTVSSNRVTVQEFLVSVDAIAANSAIRCGLMDTTGPVATAITNGIYMSITSTGITGSVANGGTINSVAVGSFTPTAGAIYYLRIESGNGNNLVNFYAKQVGSSIATGQLNVVPPSASLKFVPLIVSNGASPGVSQKASIDFCNFHQELLSGRF